MKLFSELFENVARKFCFASKLLPAIILLLTAADNFAQQPQKGPVERPYNLTHDTFTPKNSIPEERFVPDTKWRNHPEYGRLPENAPCEQCFELIEKRTETSRYFIERGSDGRDFYEQTSYGALHVKDQNGWWVSIESRLIGKGNGAFEAIHQLHPLSISLPDQNFTVGNAQNFLRWNQQLELVKRDLQGNELSLGIANFSNYTSGSDGIRIIDVWPHVDMVVYSLLSAVHTDFVFKSDPGPGVYIIKDHLDFNDSLSLIAPSGKFSSAIYLNDASGNNCFTYERAFAYDSLQNKNNLHYLDYSVSGKEVNLYMDRDELLASGLNFPITIDPLVTVTNSLAQASIGGSGYNAICFAGGCAYNLTVNSPANAILTDVLFSFNYIAQGACWMNEGATSFTYNGCNSPNLPGYFWFCNGIGGGVCAGNNLSIFNDIQACLPASSCGSVPMNFGLRFYRCFQAGGCSNNCIGANSPWTMTVRGQTVGVASAFASVGNICAGASTNLTANANWGIPPYVVSWSPGGLVGSPVTVSPAVSTVYTATITDACGNTATQNVNVTVTPSANPGFTISPNPACIGETITVTGLGAGAATSYDWLVPGSNLAAVNNVQVVNGLTYAAAGTYDITLNYAQTGCVSPLMNQVTINNGPAIPNFTSNAPICEGAQLIFDGPSIVGATYSWTGPNGFVSALEDPVIPAAGLSAAGVYQLIVQVNGCSSLPATLNVVINPTPLLPVIGSNSPVCEGQSILLTGPTLAGATYGWTGPGGYTSSSEDPVIAGAVPAQSGTYDLVITVGGCTSPMASLNVVVNPAPVPVASNTGPYCPNTQIQLNAVGGNSYSWVGPNGFASVNQNPTIANCVVANAGVYTVTVTTAGGCSATATTNVTVNSTLAIAISSNSPVCSGANLQLNGPLLAGGNYTWSGPNGYASNLQSPVINVVTNAAAGNYTLDVVDANGCTGTSNLVVVVNSLPISNASNTGPFCEGSTLQLNAGGGTNYSWTGPAAFSSLLQNPSISNCTPAMGGLYTVTVSDANNCSSVATTNVVVNASPAGVASNTGPYCAGDNISLNIAGGTTYTWSGPGGFSSLVQSPNINAATVAMSGNYTVVITGANGCTGTSSTNVVVNALPTGNVSNSGPYCEGSNISLSSSGGISYSWSGPNGYSSLLQNPGINNCVVGDGGSYSVVITNNNNCSVSLTSNVVVNPTPVITCTNTGPYCLGNTLQLDATGGSTYSWTGPLGFNANVQNPTISNVALTHAGNYSVLVTDAAGCSNTAVTSVTVNTSLPVVAGYSGQVCEGQNITFNATFYAGGVYSWTGPGGYNSATQNPTLNGVLASQGGQYDLTVTAGGCVGNASVLVSILSAPVPTASNAGPYCEGDLIQLSSGGGSTYNWSGPAGFNSVLQNPVINAVAPLNAGIYNVIVTGANNCSAVASTSVIVNPEPNVVLQSNSPYCEGTNVQLSANGGVNYQWIGPNGFLSNVSDPVVSVISLNQAGTYTVVVTDGIGCTADASVNVVVQPLPTVVFASNILEGCEPLCVQFSELSSGGSALVQWEWRANGQLISEEQAPSPCFYGAGFYEIGLTVTDANGCSSTSSIADYLHVETRPRANFTVDREVAPESEPVINFENNSIGGVVYEWDFGDGTQGNGNGVSHSFPGEGKYCVKMIARTESGCEDDHEICIEIEPDFFVFVPNTFSPNGDLLNDEFIVKGSGIKELSLDIYNRWGDKITSINEPGVGWNGMYSGRNAEQGTYVYYLKVKSASGKKAEFTGQVNLVR
jgi:gliding motility-associated-like protein